jgi:hypothetical protein
MRRPLRQKRGAFLRGHFVQPVTPGGIDGTQTAQIQHQLAIAKGSSGRVPAATEFLNIAFGELTSQLKAQRADAVVNIVFQTRLKAGHGRRGTRCRLGNRLGTSLSNGGNGCRLLQISGQSVALTVRFFPPGIRSTFFIVAKAS